ncbi:hypothetical protein CEXT_389421 [Caerostris extrusa]|uniref:Uncharacterized protein n=1 Tax=Caerostris extrusa TaxID=172846 RepID=A0AAV4MNV9_CAEEX|nr:hypothetical protein CEXT_389421 [Caerostris extrusa]
MEAANIQGRRQRQSILTWININQCSASSSPIRSETTVNPIQEDKVLLSTAIAPVKQHILLVACSQGCLLSESFAKRHSLIMIQVIESW